MTQAKKYPNYQDLYSFSDCKKAYEARETFDCELSPICLSAPDLHYSCYNDVIKGRTAEGAVVCFRTLKLEYAIRVWLRAALVSAASRRLQDYWMLDYMENGTSFREIKYYSDINSEKMAEGFWKLLEEIADSGEIKVCEGYSYSPKTDKKPHVGFVVVLDRESAKGAEWVVEDVFMHSYDLTPRTYSWSEIKDLFVQLPLKQLSLMNPVQLHKHTEIDEMLFTACRQQDLEGVKNAVRMGADVNALDTDGNSALQHTLAYFMDYGKMADEEYSDEELQAINAENYKRSVEIVDYLLDCGADIDLFGMDGRQPLLEAYYNRSLEMVRHLLERGANPNYNSFRSDDLSSGKDEDSTLLDTIKLWPIGDDDEDGDYDQSVEKLIREYGGRNHLFSD